MAFFYRVALRVVVEISKDVYAGSELAANPSGFIAERPARVTPGVAIAVVAEIGPGCGQDARMVIEHVVDAQGRSRGA